MRHVRPDEAATGVLRADIHTDIVALVKMYQGVGTVTPSDDYEFVIWLHIEMAKRMFKNPVMSDLATFVAWRRLYGTPHASRMVEAWIEEQNEYKYQRQCIDTFMSWSPVAPAARRLAWLGQKRPLRVRYYGPIGTSGYARACANVMDCLMDRSDLDVEFVPYTIQTFCTDSPDRATLRARSAVRASTATAVDVVMIHSIPDLWIQIVRAERAMNASVLTIGMTVWETDRLPFEWSAHMRWVDRVVFPNEWNTGVAMIDLPGLDATCLYHPVITPPSVSPTLLPCHNAIPHGAFVIYTINEFSGRKGIDALIRTYMEAFTGNDSVLLILKTGGAVAQHVAQAYIDRLASARRDPPAILLQYGTWTDAEIAALHSAGHCYVSLTKAEGQGLGACEAAAVGNRVIMTRYGAQTEYLKDAGVDWVRYSLGPASFCSAFDDGHDACRDLPSCRFFPTFLPTAQQWAVPDEHHAAQLLRRAYLERDTWTPLRTDWRRLFTPKAVGAAFAAFFHDTVDTRRARPFPTGLPDPFDQPERFFAPQRDTLPMAMTTGPRVTRPRPRVTIIGCSGSGNVGDDLYRAMFEAYLGRDADLSVCSTQSFVGPDGAERGLDEYREGMNLPVDYVVIGGGGLMNDGELSSSIFSVYLPYCTARKIPVALVSVGFGYPCIDGLTITMSAAGRALWGRLLSVADLVTVRSMADRDLVLDLIPRSRRHLVRIYPDLVYGCGTVYPPRATSAVPAGPYVVFCPTTTISVAKRDVAVLVRQQLDRAGATTLVFLALGGIDDPTVYPSPFVLAELERVREMFTDMTLIVYTGRRPNTTQPQTLARCVDLVRSAAVVVTGRYHGVVLATAFGIPCVTGITSLVKIVEERNSILDRTTWMGHITDLCHHIHASVCAGQSSNLEWDEDQRNTGIVDLATQDTTTDTVEYLQGLTTRDIWTRRRAMLTRQCVPSHRTCEPWRVTIV
jgi:glycosyltransferase involved in cell wall biosynthesis